MKDDAVGTFVGGMIGLPQWSVVLKLGVYGVMGSLMSGGYLRVWRMSLTLPENVRKVYYEGGEAPRGPRPAWMDYTKTLKVRVYCTYLRLRFSLGSYMRRLRRSMHD